MSYTFSRRTFFKYSLTAAAALAGASLLGGCEVQDPYTAIRFSLGAMETMQITANLESFDMASGKFKLSLQSSRGNPVLFSQYCIAVKVLDAEKKTTLHYYDGDDLTFTIDSGFPNGPRLYTNEEASFTFQVSGFVPVEPEQVVQIQYIPVRESASYSMRWELTNPKEETGDSSTTDPDTGDATTTE